MTYGRHTVVLSFVLAGTVVVHADSTKKESADSVPAAKQSATKSAPSFEIVERDGMVRPYRDVLKDAGIKIQGENPGELLALVEKDGTVTPLAPTETARFFYDDPAMQNRAVRIRARWYPKLSALHVLEVRSLRNDKPYAIYYWCEICSIRMGHRQDCECCRGPTVVREHPVGQPYSLKNDPNRATKSD